MANLNVKLGVDFEFDVVAVDDYVELYVFNSVDDCGYPIFRVFEDGSSEVLTSELENLGLNPDVNII
jgi:hypothetical protein